MQKTIIILAAFLALGARSEAEPLSTRCIGVRPICMPGQVPMCLCESSYSMNCAWICAGR
jgi:hypothetical protein